MSSKLTKPQQGRVDRTMERITRMLSKLDKHEIDDTESGFDGTYQNSQYGRRVTVVVNDVEMIIDISARRLDRD